MDKHLAGLELMIFWSEGPLDRAAKAQMTSRVAGWYIFVPKIQVLGVFWSSLEWKLLVYFMVVFNILRSLGIHN
jgi:hypothetical protein